MDTIPPRDRRAAALHRSFVIASLARDVLDGASAVRQDFRTTVTTAPLHSFWLALEEPDRAVWRTVADAS